MASTGEGTRGGQAGTVELLWGLRERPTRGPKPALSLERIADAAVAVADAEGMAAVSMQRVASALDFTKMSLYRYVTGKDELVAAMIEAAVGEPPDLSDVPGGWRGRLEEYARRLWATWQRHPWLPGATVGQHRIMGPREVGWSEAAVSALDGTPLGGRERLDAVFLLSGHIRNTHSMSTAGSHPWTADQQFSPAVANLKDVYRVRYPALTAAVGAAAADPSIDNGREFGLRRILDGLELLITERQRPSSPHPTS
ncbi:MAG: TetR/AcrR family transcriptional regulator [Mycobacteriales bacterium]